MRSSRRPWPSALPAVLAAALLTLAACGGGSSSSAPSVGGGVSGGGAGKTVTVTEQNLKFKPANLTIPAGTTVEWVNKDTVDHNVTSQGNSPAQLNSGTMAPGRTWTFTFTKPGVYKYDCTFHVAQHMVGTITVS
jgi:plastocyanin